MSAALKKHLSDLQAKALQATCLSEALNAVIDYREHHDIAVALLEKIHAIAEDLNNGLDSIGAHDPAGILLGGCEV